MPRKAQTIAKGVVKPPASKTPCYCGHLKFEHYNGPSTCAVVGCLCPGFKKRPTRGGPRRPKPAPQGEQTRLFDGE